MKEDTFGAKLSPELYACLDQKTQEAYDGALDAERLDLGGTLTFIGVMGLMFTIFGLIATAFVCAWGYFIN